MTKIVGIVNLSCNDDVIYKNKKISGIKNDNKITYYEDKIKVNIIINEDITIKRNTSEYEITLNFKSNNHTEGKYIDKLDNLFLLLDIFTDKIIVGNNLIIINYKLNDENYKFKLEFEVK